MTPRAVDQRGFTLIEMLVAMTITLIVIGAVVSILTVFLNDNRYDQFRDDATAHAQTMVDRLSRDMRSGASITAGSSGLLADAGPYDVGFQTVSATAQSASAATQTAGSNATNHVWVRYCLGSNYTIWRQSETLATTTSNSAFPDPTSTVNSLPVDSAGCPSSSTSWIQTSSGQPCCVETTDAVNEIGGDNRPLFSYGPNANPTSVAQIKTVQVDLYVDDNPGHTLPGPTHLTSGIYLRNELGAPVSAASATKTAVSGGADITLNGSASSDPNGQALSYQWYQGSTCTSSSTVLTNGTTQVYNAGVFANGNYTFSLLVTNTAGLTNCNSTSVSVP